MPCFLYLLGFGVSLLISHRDRNSLPESSSALLICSLPRSNSGHHEGDRGLPPLKTFRHPPHHQDTAQTAQPGMVSRKISSFNSHSPHLRTQQLQTTCSSGTCFCLQPHSFFCLNAISRVTNTVNSLTLSDPVQLLFVSMKHSLTL